MLSRPSQVLPSSAAPQPLPVNKAQRHVIILLWTDLGNTRVGFLIPQTAKVQASGSVRHPFPARRFFSGSFPAGCSKGDDRGAAHSQGLKRTLPRQRPRSAVALSMLCQCTLTRQSLLFRPFRPHAPMDRKSISSDDADGRILLGMILVWPDRIGLGVRQVVWRYKRVQCLSGRWRVIASWNQP